MVHIEEQIFAIFSANGSSKMSPEQQALLVGKARWIAEIAKANIKTVPTICITRKAWEALKAERKGENTYLRNIWVKTLLKLVEPGKSPPLLAVRTSALNHNIGLMRAKLNIKPPATPEQAVSEDSVLVRAIDFAFSSYETNSPIWSNNILNSEIDRQIIIIQAMAKGDLFEFYSRNLQTGEIGPLSTMGEMQGNMPKNAKEIASIVDKIAGHHMLCLVSVENEEAIFLSARTIEASIAAKLEAAVDRVEAGYWSPKTAIKRLDIEHIPSLLHPRLARDINLKPVGVGLGVSPGAASGKIVFSAEDAIRAHARGQPVILVATETGPADIDGMMAANGILTSRGGNNSHAAIIARVAAKPCIAGAGSLEVDKANSICRIGEKFFRIGDWITIDGADGRIFAGSLPLLQPDMGVAITKLLNWSDGSRTIAVRANVETVESAITALNFGAEGIGLARSEHMFFTHERMIALRRLILSENEEERKLALKGLVEYQSKDYAKLFSTMGARPVTVRLFDPPLHEFLPKSEEDIEETAFQLSLTVEEIKARLEKLGEVNPMLGNRGCRLAISHPEILQMQIHALFQGARSASKETSMQVNLEIMVPFIASVREVAWLRARIRDIAEREKNKEIIPKYSFGTMIELPRAALRAAEIAPLVDFFSFGTNDLTQTCFGISRDDAPSFLAIYKRKAIYDNDPFTTIDKRGVGELIKIAIDRGRKANPTLKIGICGEHAGDSASIKFFAKLGIDYVSCAPYRVPIARLALAQAEE